MDGWVGDGWVGGWMNGWVDEWMNYGCPGRSNEVDFSVFYQKTII